MREPVRAVTELIELTAKQFNWDNTTETDHLLSTPPLYTLYISHYTLGVAHTVNKDNETTSKLKYALLSSNAFTIL